MAKLEAKAKAAAADAELAQRAAKLLIDFAKVHRENFLKVLSDACTNAVQQLFGMALAVEITADGDVYVTQTLSGGRSYRGRLQQSLGASVRNLVAFAIWLQLFWIVRQRNREGCATVLWDEPFVNVSVHLLPRAAELIRGCADLGIQVIQASIHPQTVPDGTDVTIIAAGDPGSQVL